MKNVYWIAGFKEGLEHFLKASKHERIWHGVAKKSLSTIRRAQNEGI